MGRHFGRPRKRRFSLAFILAVVLAVTLFASVAAELRARAASGQGPTTAEPPDAQAAVPDWQTAAGGKQAFDVASVKRNKCGPPPDCGGQYTNFSFGPGDAYVPNGGLFSARDIPLIDYIMFAYKVTSLGDLHGVPNIAMTEKFDIEARAQGNPNKDQMRLMMQALLASRFKLAIHTEGQTKPIYALVLSKPGKTGPQLQLYVDDGSCPTATDLSAPPPAPSASTSTSRLQLAPMSCGGLGVLPASAPGHVRVGGKKVPMTLIARMLPSGALAGVDRPVFDHTGLSGFYNFSIEWIPALYAELTRKGVAPPEFATDDTEPTFTEALQDQLGLKLEPQTGRVDVFVIDHVEQPSEN
jgi:uncharacterized protein (TIGR03435 family)